MYILNIDKSKSHTTPQIVGRVADLPYSPLEVQVFNGMEVLDLTGYTIEFRGVTSTDNKVMISSGFKTTNAKNGEFEFTFPKNFYSAPGKFKRAYFVVKKNGKTDSTQDMLIHVLDSVGIDLQDAEDIFEGLDKIIKEVEAQAKKDVDRIIKQIEKDTTSTIADSNKKLAELDKQMNDFKNNTNNTIKELNSNIGKLDSNYSTLSDKVDEIAKMIEESELVTQEQFKNLKIGFRNLIRNGDFSQGLDHYFYTSGMNIRVQDVATSYRYPVTPSGKELRVEIPKGSKSMFLNQDIDINFDKGTKVLGLHFHYYTSLNFEGYFRPYIRIITTDGETKYLNSTMEARDTNSKLVIFNNVAELEGYSVESARMVINFSDVVQGTVWIQGITLVDGEHIGDWTPATEDLLDKYTFDNTVVNQGNLVKNSGGNLTTIDFWKPNWLKLKKHPYYKNGEENMFLMETSSPNEYVCRSEYFKLDNDREYTVSYDAFSSSNVSSYDIYIMWRKKDSEKDFDGHIRIINEGNLPTASVGSFYHHITLPKDAHDAYFRIDNNGSSDGKISYLFFTNVSVTPGSTKVHWTPSFDDYVKFTDYKLLESKIDNLHKAVTAMGGS